MATTVKVMSKRKGARYSSEYRVGALYRPSELAAHKRGVSDRECKFREEKARLKRQLAGKTEENETLVKIATCFAKKLGSLYVAGDVPAGHLLCKADIDYRRLGTGIPPDRLADVLSKPLARGKNAGQLLKSGNLGR